MAYVSDPYRRASAPAQAGNDREPSLPFEAEFEGARRPVDVGERLCDPQRYWTIFDGTD